MIQRRNVVACKLNAKRKSTNQILRVSKTGKENWDSKKAKTN